jgi:molecular chaperone GrpE
MDKTDAVEQEPPADEVAELRRALDRERERGLRLLADFENYRRRAARERETTQLEGRREALLPVLPVVDTLERALETGSTDLAFVEGVAATHAMLLAALRQAGAEPIDAMGQPFDPKTHEAVGAVAATGVDPGTVTQQVRRGWRLGDSLLRPAQVVVASLAEASPSWP